MITKGARGQESSAGTGSKVKFDRVGTDLPAEKLARWSMTGVSEQRLAELPIIPTIFPKVRLL